MERLATGNGSFASPAPDRSVKRATAGPQRRPPIALRVLAGLLAAGAVVFNAALMLSDRAPRATRRILGGFQRRLSERIDADGRAHLAADEYLPEGDAIIHISVWAVAVILVGMMVWSWRGLAIAALGVFAVSIAIELGQGRFSETRSVENSDILANAAGIAVGVTLTACAYLAWSAVSAALTKFTHDPLR